VGHGDRRPADRTASRTRGPRGARTRQSPNPLPAGIDLKNSLKAELKLGNARPLDLTGTPLFTVRRSRAVTLGLHNPSGRSARWRRDRTRCLRRRQSRQVAARGPSAGAPGHRNGRLVRGGLARSCCTLLGNRSRRRCAGSPRIRPPELSSPSGSELTEQSPVDPGHDLGQVLRDQPRTGRAPRFAMQPDRRRRCLESRHALR